MDGAALSMLLLGLLGLVAAAAVARRRLAAGRRRDALSIALVVLGLVTAFVLFFAAGTLVRKGRQSVAALEWRGPDAAAPAASLQPIRGTRAGYLSR